MSRYVKVALAAILVALVLTGAIALNGLSDFELSDHAVTDHRFDVAALRIEASLVLPADCSDPAVAVFVHGDGAQDRWSDDGYLPLTNALLDACIGVFSWDKPGVGTSTGNWLNQSMHDRATLAAAALSYVQALPALSPDRIGYLGFSQAGWVVPNATSLSLPSFSVLIGPAVNWRQQGRYFASVRLRRSGHGPDEINRIVNEQTTANDHLFASSVDSGQQAPKEKDSRIDNSMDDERFVFVQRNYLADATESIAKLGGPLLAVWGEHDANVDPIRNSEIYQRLLPDNDTQRVVRIADATHGLLRVRWFNYQTLAQWPLSAKIMFAMLGRHAYAADSIEMLTSWINDTTGGSLHR